MKKESYEPDKVTPIDSDKVRAGTTFHEWRSVNDLHKSPYNARHTQHTEEHIQAIEEEIRERDFNEILKITPDGGVLNGWARVLAARRIDSNYKVPCYLIQETNPMELLSISSKAGNLQESLSYDDNRKNALLIYQSGYNRNKASKKLGVSWHNIDRWVVEEEFATISSTAYSEIRRGPESDSGWTRERWRSFKKHWSG